MQGRERRRQSGAARPLRRGGVLRQLVVCLLRPWRACLEPRAVGAQQKPCPFRIVGDGKGEAAHLSRALDPPKLLRAFLRQERPVALGDEEQCCRVGAGAARPEPLGSGRDGGGLCGGLRRGLGVRRCSKRDGGGEECLAWGHGAILSSVPAQRSAPATRTERRSRNTAMRS
jgi:hypothetical protein